MAKHLSKTNPVRLRRSESFLGIHFDKHMNHTCTQVGKTVTRQMVQRTIDLVHPDYIQVDCKGHPGICGYPSLVGHPAPGFVRDQLRIWRDVTAENGVALYMHYSGVWDTEAVKRHPSWARIDENGKRDKNITSVFGPYVDQLLIPQLKELRDEYDVDGIWLDGECWGTAHDYGKKALAEFRKKTGIRNVPKKRGDPHFFEFTEFCRQAFRNYLKHYVDELHRHDPDYQICSNWAFTSVMPEPVSVDIDFISGDYPPNNSLNAVRLEARVMARQGKAWDLMAWSFCRTPGQAGQISSSTKSPVQLKQEAAGVLSIGGGFQAYFKQNDDGSINDWTMNLMAEVAEFCRARQEVCHRAEAVPQIALVYSGKAMYRGSSRLFSPWDTETPFLRNLRGILYNLLDSRHSTEVLLEHQLTGRMNQYPLIVIAEHEYLQPKFKKELLDYVASGGKLLLIGPAMVKMFRKQLKVKLVGKPAEKSHWLEHHRQLSEHKTFWQGVKLERDAKAFGKMFEANNFKGKAGIPAVITKLGRGMIAATFADFGERYFNCRTTVARDFIASLVRKLFPQPMVEVSGPGNVDVQVNRKSGKLMINLLNMSGPHGDDKVCVFDEVPAVGPLDIVIRTKTKPKKVTLCPCNKNLRYTYAKGEIRLQLKKLQIHDVIVIH